jgi:hypothetical protein
MPAQTATPKSLVTLVRKIATRPANPERIARDARLARLKLAMLQGMNA